MKYGGALPIQLIREMVQAGFISNAKEENIRTGSLDITVTDDWFRVRGAFLPAPNETVEEALHRVGAKAIPAGSILEPGSCYVCKVNESIKELPEGVYAYANPKSSSGRLDIHVRTLVNNVSRYDSIPKGYIGQMWNLVSPKKFPVIIPTGTSLGQLRFFSEDTRLDQIRLQLMFEQNGGLLCRSDGGMIKFRQMKHSDNDGSVILTLGLNFEMPGFEAVTYSEPIDLSKVGYYDPEYFFRPIQVSKGSLSLSADTFYILSTQEYVRVPAMFACEMSPMDERSGEMRSHYAGFIDSGWGIGPDGSGHGRPLTLEVRSFDNGLIIQEGQPIAKIKYERVIETPETHYDQMSPNYGAQNGPQLSKHFKAWK